VRYARGEELHEQRPSPPLDEALAGVTPGLALDLACGAGRHALALAERGWQVVAVDGSHVAIDLLRAAASRRGLGDRITPRVVDLDADPVGFPFDGAAYDLIADFYFLRRELFPAVRTGIRAGGRLVAAIHSRDPEHPDPHRFLLEPGELATLVTSWGWEILLSREGRSPESGHDHATTQLVARRPA
jgi:tellurite methyltransferase